MLAAMRRPLVLAALSSILLLAGCPQQTDDDDSAEIPDHPELVETEWIGDLAGQITYDKVFTSGDLEGTECTELFNVNGSRISVPPQECVACDLVYQVFVTRTQDCPGSDDLADDGQAGFDLRQTEEQGVMWWFFSGGWSDDVWSELGTGDLTQDWEGSQLDFLFPFTDPDNGDTFSNNTHVDIGDGCIPGCEFTGEYTMDFSFDFVLPDDWYEQSQAN